jgi:hypothetical protein
MGKAEEAVSNLQSPDLEVRKGAARFIKNAIIGNKIKKRYFANLGVIRRLIEILTYDTDEGIIIQSAAAIGSFACENARAVNDAGAARLLIKILTHPNPKVVETAARSLKIVFLSKHCPHSLIFEGDTTKLVVSLLSHPNEIVNEVAATIISRSCDEENSERRELYINQGALDPLLRLLRAQYPKTQEAALEALASITYDAPDVCIAVSTRDGGAHLDTFVKFIRDPRARVRLASCTIISNMCQTKTLPSKIHNLSKQLIPIIIRLFSDESVREDAPQVLARLVGYNEELQLTATEAEAIPKLGQLLQSATSDRLRENVLNALAIISSLREESRKQVVEGRLLGHVVQLLGSSHAGIRAAACRCTRSLSRSVKHLRTSLVDAGVAIPLFKLLDDPSLEVQVAASAALCNIVLDFSPMKKVVLESGALSRLVTLLDSMDPALRLNGLWALKNLAYEAELPLKEAIMKELTSETLYRLVFDTDLAIQEQALALLRNLVYKDVDTLFATESQAIDLVRAVERVFEAQMQQERSEVLKQSIYVVCNMATGSETHKNAIMGSSVPQHLLHFMEHKSSPIRVAAVWCTINLGWAEGSGVQPRVARLRELGFDRKLEDMREDPDVDVRDRVKNALNLLDQSVDLMDK